MLPARVILELQSCTFGWAVGMGGEGLETKMSDGSDGLRCGDT